MSTFNLPGRKKDEPAPEAAATATPADAPEDKPSEQ